MIFFTVLRVFLVKKHAAFKWKDAISGFPVSPGSAEALVRWGGKTNYTLIAYFLGNICDKNCRNRTMYVKIIASQSGMFFLRHSVHVVVRKVLFLAPLVCGFLFVYEISLEPLNGFAPNSGGRRVWSLTLRSLKVKVEGQGQSQGQRAAFFGPFGGLCAVYVW